MSNSSSLTQLAVRVLLDVPSAQPTDGAYLFGQTEENTTSVITRGVTLLERGETQRLLISGFRAECGYPGFEAYRERLLEAGVSPEKILGVDPPEGPIMHTTNEGRALISFALRKGFRSLHIVAAPLHQLRAYISAVSAVIKTGAPLALFSAPGEAHTWETIVRHSQGKATGSRAELLSGEIERIERYRACGDLASNEEIWAYLKARQG